MINVAKKGSIIQEKSELFIRIQSPFASNGLYFLTSFGHEFWNSDYLVERDHYDLYMLHYVIKGNVKITLKDKTMVLKAGDLIFLNLHEYSLMESVGEPEIYFFHLDGSDLANLYNQFLRFDDCVIHNFPLSEIRAFYNELKSYQNGSLNYFLISASIYKFLMHVLDKKNVSSMETYSPLMKRICEYIYTTYPIAEPKEIANRLGYNLTYLERLFKRQRGESITSFILKTKYNRACHLLLNTTLNVSQIATELGYATPQGLIGLFKKIGKTTPQAYKKSHQK